MPKKPVKKTTKKKTSQTTTKSSIKKPEKKVGIAVKIKAPKEADVSKIKAPKADKCCPHCPDHKYCKDKGSCCNYCDYYFKGKCMYEKEKNLLSRDGEVIMEMNDYRGDDYGIDDYEAYESVYD
ncbi:hypothetical protein ACFLRF_04495 [Candidatus Altiarchaeota archaeon]